MPESTRRVAAVWKLGLLVLALMLLAPVLSYQAAAWVERERLRPLEELEADRMRLREALMASMAAVLRYALSGDASDRGAARRALGGVEGILPHLTRHARPLSPGVRTASDEVVRHVRQWNRRVARPMLAGGARNLRAVVEREGNAEAPSALSVTTSLQRLQEQIVEEQVRVRTTVARIQTGGLLALAFAALLALTVGAQRMRTELSLEAARRREEAERVHLEAILHTLPIGVLVADGRSLAEATATANPAYQDLHGISLPGPVRVGDMPSLGAYYYPDRATRVPVERLPGVRAAVAGECVDQEELHVHRPDGQWRVALDTAAPLRDARGEITGSVVALQDITERYRLAQENLAQRTYLDAVLEQMPEAVFILDADGRLQRANPQGRRLVGKHAEERHPDIASVVEAVHLAYSDGRPVPPEEAPPARALRGETVKGELLAIRCPESGENVYTAVSAAPLRDAGGRVTGAVIVAADVTERRHLEEELRQANEAKDRFLAVLSHELRNPLASLQAAADVLRRAPDDLDRVRRTAEVIDRSVRMEARLVNDLLDLSRIRRGKLEVRRQAVELGPLVARAVDGATDDAARAQVTLEGNVCAGLWLNGDPDRLHQIVWNLLSNAIKFTPAGGRVHVSAAPAGEKARLLVEDSGVGMAPDVLPHVFELFRQAEPGGRGGLGIGLALVQSLTEMHGGRVWAESAGPGQGSRFTVELPRAAPPDLQNTEGDEAVRECQPV